MRGSGWIPAIAGGVLCLIAVVLPLVALLARVPLAFEATDSPDVGAVFLRTCRFAIIIAVCATLIGWLPGRAIGAAMSRRGAAIWAALVLVPICLPGYLVYYAWWQSWPADSAIFRFAVEHGSVQLAREITVVLGMVCWAWPIAALCVAAVSSRRGWQFDEQLRLDGARLGRRLIEAARQDGPGASLGAAMIFLLAFGNTICFDLANVYSFGFTLRTMEAENAGSGPLIRTALPAIGLSVVLIAILWPAVARRSTAPPPKPRRFSRGLIAVFATVWLATVLLPVSLLVRRFDSERMSQFITGYSDHLGHGVGLAAVTAGLGVIIGLGVATLWHDGRRWVSVLAHGQALLWMLVAVIPGPIVGLALEAAYNRPWMLWPGKNGEDGLGTGAAVSHLSLADVVYESPLILAIGHLARFALVPVLLARWLTAGEPPALRDQRMLEGRQRLPVWLHTHRPGLIAMSLAAAAVVFVFSLSEIEVTARLSPPGFESLASSLLNFMHYQQVETVMAASLLFIGGAVVAALLVAAAWMARRAAAVAAVMAIVAVSIPGCGGDQPDQYGVVALDTELTFGAAGPAMGQFNYPRGISADTEHGLLYIVDKAGRVQRFDLNGEPQFQWKLPEWENGKPTGLSVGPHGRVYVADTHYHRVLVYDGDGHELMRFGEYGEGPGQFIFPTDIAFGPHGRLYVSEYGGNDRIQVFSPTGDFLFMFGEFGDGEGQFSRPQSIAFNDDQTELYITDACNHRIVVTDPEGNTQRTFGHFGRKVAELAYPYGLDLLEDGTLLVCEFGNNRVQRFSTAGESLGAWGGIAVEKGRLQYPWAVAGVGDRVYIVDSGNNRVQMSRGI